MIRRFLLPFLAIALSACVTTADSGSSGASGSDKAKGPRNIVGTWEVSRADSIITCRLVVEAGNNRDSGKARPGGCINFERLNFANRWEWKNGRFEFYAFVNELVMVAKRVDRDEFRGYLQPKDIKVTIIRK
ncbi:MAG: hypothetical protein RIC87_24540 [Kiloniellales bacterium]